MYTVPMLALHSSQEFSLFRGVLLVDLFYRAYCMIPFVFIIVYAGDQGRAIFPFTIPLICVCALFSCLGWAQQFEIVSHWDFKEMVDLCAITCCVWMLVMALVAGAALYDEDLASWEMMREGNSTNLEPTNRTGISTTGGGIEFASGLWFLVRACCFAHCCHVCLPTLNSDPVLRPDENLDGNLIVVLKNMLTRPFLPSSPKAKVKVDSRH